MNKILLVAISIFFSLSMKAQDTIVYSNFNSNLDSLINLWYVKNSDIHNYKNRPDTLDTTFIPSHTADYYISKIDEIQTVLPLTYNDRVQAFINVYGYKNREKFEIMLGLAEYYFPLFEEIFELHDAPQDLKYLAVIESALNPRARSRVGAMGLWQFMPATGKMFKLDITSYLDERRDPILATHAAADYLTQLYGMFDDWILAIAAYNCGPGNVRKAIARSGGKRDFWEIYPYLPRETRGYVPAFIGAYFVFENHEDFNLYPREVNYPAVVDTVMVTQSMTFNQISKVLGISEEMIEDINPQYKLGAIPKSKTGMSLYLPIEYVVPFVKLQDSIIAYKDSVNTDSIRLVKLKQATTNEKSVVYYTIKSGDNLSLIASWYNVNVSDIRRWNGIKGNNIRAGKRLTIYVPAHKQSTYNKVNKMSYAQKQKFAGNSSSVTETTTKATSSSSAKIATTTKASADNYHYYTVMPGDTLWDIAQKYDNVSTSDIKRLNGLYSSRIKPGMKIKIKQL